MGNGGHPGLPDFCDATAWYGGGDTLTGLQRWVTSGTVFCVLLGCVLKHRKCQEGPTTLWGCRCFNRRSISL